MATLKEKLSNIAKNPESNFDNQNLRTKKTTYAKAYTLLREMVAEFAENIAKFETDFYNADIDDKEKVFAKKCKDIKYPNLPNYKDDLSAFLLGIDSLVKPEDVEGLKGKSGNEELNIYLRDIAQLYEDYCIQCKNMAIICKSLFGELKKDKVIIIDSEPNDNVNNPDDIPVVNDPVITHNPQEIPVEKVPEIEGDNIVPLTDDNNMVDPVVVNPDDTLDEDQEKIEEDEDVQVVIEDVIGDKDFSIKEEEPKKVYDMFDYLHANLGIRDKQQDNYNFNAIERFDELERLIRENQINNVVEEVVNDELEEQQNNNATDNEVNEETMNETNIDEVSHERINFTNGLSWENEDELREDMQFLADYYHRAREFCDVLLHAPALTTEGRRLVNGVVTRVKNIDENLMKDISRALFRGDMRLIRQRLEEVSETSIEDTFHHRIGKVYSNHLEQAMENVANIYQYAEENNINIEYPMDFWDKYKHIAPPQQPKVTKIDRPEEPIGPEPTNPDLSAKKEPKKNNTMEYFRQMEQEKREEVNKNKTGVYSQTSVVEGAPIEYVMDERSRELHNAIVDSYADADKVNNVTHNNSKTTTNENNSNTSAKSDNLSNLRNRVAEMRRERLEEAIAEGIIDPSDLTATDYELVYGVARTATQQTRQPETNVPTHERVIKREPSGATTEATEKAPKVTGNEGEKASPVTDVRNDTNNTEVVNDENTDENVEKEEIPGGTEVSQSNRTVETEKDEETQPVQYEDPLLRQVIEFTIKNNLASISAIQRNFRAGFNRAGKLMERMEEMGVVGPYNSANPRKVLWTMDDYNKYYNVASTGENDKYHNVASTGENKNKPQNQRTQNYPNNNVQEFDADDFDPNFKRVVRSAIAIGSTSRSIIQRTEMMGYNRAGNILDKMEELGIVEKGDGTQPRKVLWTPEDYEDFFNEKYYYPYVRRERVEDSTPVMGEKTPGMGITSEEGKTTTEETNASSDKTIPMPKHPHTDSTEAMDADKDKKDGRGIASEENNETATKLPDDVNVDEDSEQVEEETETSAEETPKHTEEMGPKPVSKDEVKHEENVGNPTEEPDKDEAKEEFEDIDVTGLIKDTSRAERKKHGFWGKVGRWIAKHPVITAGIALGAACVVMPFLGVAGTTALPSVLTIGALSVVAGGNFVKQCIVKPLSPRYRHFVKQYNVDKYMDKIDKIEAQREMILREAEDILVNERVGKQSRKYAHIPTRGEEKYAFNKKTRKSVNMQVDSANADLNGISEEDMFDVVTAGVKLEKLAKEEKKYRKKFGKAYNKLESVDEKIGNKEQIGRTKSIKKSYGKQRELGEVEKQAIDLAPVGLFKGSKSARWAEVDAYTDNMDNTDGIDFNYAKAVEEAIKTGNERVAYDIAAEDIALNGGTLNPELEKVIVEGLDADRAEKVKRYIRAKSKENAMEDNENKTSDAIYRTIEMEDEETEAAKHIRRKKRNAETKESVNKEADDAENRLNETFRRVRERKMLSNEELREVEKNRRENTNANDYWM